MKPTVVCICGSTKFYEAYLTAMYEETMKGNIYLSVGCFMHRPEIHQGNWHITPEHKLMLDELHLRKIDIADEILVLNVGGYIGESTENEIVYAEQCGKGVRYLEAHEQET